MSPRESDFADARDPYGEYSRTWNPEDSWADFNEQEHSQKYGFLAKPRRTTEQNETSFLSSVHSDPAYEDFARHAPGTAVATARGAEKKKKRRSKTEPQQHGESNLLITDLDGDERYGGGGGMVAGSGRGEYYPGGNEMGAGSDVDAEVEYVRAVGPTAHGWHEGKRVRLC